MVDRASEGRDPGVRTLSEREEVTAPWTLAPALSPDGTTLAYLSTRGGESFDLWLADPRTGEPLRRLVQGGRSPGLESLRFMSSSPSFSPDGQTLAFMAKAGAPVEMIGFLEAGLAWSRRLCRDGSLGVGVRLNLLLAQLESHHARPVDRPGRSGVWGLVLSPLF